MTNQVQPFQELSCQVNGFGLGSLGQLDNAWELNLVHFHTHLYHRGSFCKSHAVLSATDARLSHLDCFQKRHLCVPVLWCSVFGQSR